MEAKDTVKIPESHSESIWCPHCGEEFGIEDKVLYERETQAEISFKAGKDQGYKTGFDDGQNYSFTVNCTVQSIKDEAKKAGIREVVKWVERNCPMSSDLFKQWQAFKESKGVE